MMAGVGRLSETFDLYPPKAEVTGSNPVGRANKLNSLAGFLRPLDEALSAVCPRIRARYERLPFTACSPQRPLFRLGAAVQIKSAAPGQEQRSFHIGGPPKLPCSQHAARSPFPRHAQEERRAWLRYP